MLWIKLQEEKNIYSSKKKRTWYSCCQKQQIAAAEHAQNFLTEKSTKRQEKQVSQDSQYPKTHELQCCTTMSKSKLSCNNKKNSLKNVRGCESGNPKFVWLQMVVKLQCPKILPITTLPPTARVSQLQQRLLKDRMVCHQLKLLSMQSN